MQIEVGREVCVACQRLVRDVDVEAVLAVDSVSHRLRIILVGARSRGEGRQNEQATEHAVIVA